MARSVLFQILTRVLQKAAFTDQVSTGKTLPLVRKQRSKRRRFLRLAALSGGGVLASTAIPSLQSAQSQSGPRIAIVGGGIAGLNAAYQLKKLGLTATVYEAKSRLGGRMQSVTGAVSEGLVNDLGGSFINTDHDDMLALVEEFGLELFNRYDDPKIANIPETVYYFEGSSVSESELVEALHPLAKQIAADVAKLDANFGRHAARFDRLSVADYLNTHTDKIPSPFIRTLLENTVRTEFGVEAAQASALQLLFILPTVKGDSAEILSSDETFLVKGGSSQIIERLAAALSGQIQTRHRLTQVQSQGTKFLLTFNQQTEIEADYAILALPFMVLRNVELQIDLPDTLRRFIREVNLGWNEKVLAGFRDRVWRRADGFWSDAWTDLGFSELWEDTQRQPELPAGVLTFYLGGEEVRTARTNSASQLGQQFLGDLDVVMPELETAATGKFLRTQWVGDPDIRGAYTYFQPGQYTEFSGFLYVESDDPGERQDVNLGNLVFAGEHLSDEFYGYMNGGAQTGRLAAEVVASRIEVQA